MNKTGKTFPVCRGLFIEKIYHRVFPSADGESGSAWVRIPFYTSASWGTTARPDITWKQDITEKSLQKDFEFTPGQYRLVMFAGDGPLTPILKSQDNPNNRRELAMPALFSTHL